LIIKFDYFFFCREIETKIDIGSIFRNLKKPKDFQLRRVLDCSKNSAEYNRNTSLTVIGDSKFDDFELFEL